MRVFELARELNIPSKDLIQRINVLGFHVEGNFNVLDEKTVLQIKGKLLEPVSRVEEKVEAPGEDEQEEQPRKRRIISARRSQEVHRIQESLGVSGPLPEDEVTRSEVSAEARVRKPKEEALLPGDGAAPEEAAAGEALQEGSPRLVKTEPIPEGEAEAPPSPEGEAATPATPAAAAPAKPAGVAPVAARHIVPEAPEGQSKWGDPKKTDRKHVSIRDLEAERNTRREMLRAERQPGTEEGGDEWVRVPRRKSPDRRPQRGGRMAMRAESGPKHTFAPRRRAIRLGQNITVSELAGVLGVKAPDIIKRLMVLGVMATVNDSIEGTTAELIGSEFNVPIELDTTNIEDFVKEEPVDESQLKSRPPIVTVMGHVDHGKTSLLDHIRETQVAEREAGGITQHIGASLVNIAAGSIVFVDTPGHEAFTSMRARGANITDLVVLVVAADDGVMPQTTEAIEHARAAKVPIMVAINKMDRPNADVEKIKRQLMEHELLAEELGGETIMVPVSAKTGEGVAHLLEMIQLQAEIMELKATPEGPARGFVIEARMDRRRGPVATVIVRRGTLQAGDYFVVGSTQGRVKAIFDDHGEPVSEAGPSHPVEILGYAELPDAGDELVVVPEEKIARQIAAGRANRKQAGDSVERRRMHLEDFIQGVESAEEDTLNVVLKADAHGPLEAIRSALEIQGNAQARARVIRGGVGGISENDISLAATTNAVVIGFNVRPEAKAGSLARSEGVEVKLYTVIYELIEDIRKALEGLLKPIVREEVIGHCEVRQIFSVSKEGQIAGGFITDGRLERNGLVRLYRDNVLIHSGTISSLRRFKEDVAQVSSGYECGVRIAKFTDIQEGDYIESYVQVEEAQTLDSVARQ